jgi:hypothetical protein
MTASQYLESQARHSREGARLALDRLKGDLRSLVDPRAIIRRHPVISLGLGAVAGFVLGHELASPRTPARAALRRTMVSLVSPALSALRSMALPALLSAIEKMRGHTPTTQTTYQN